MIKNRNEVNATAFIADQTPAPEGAYWTTFLNQDTPIFWGTEKIAIKLIDEYIIIRKGTIQILAYVAFPKLEILINSVKRMLSSELKYF